MSALTAPSLALKGWDYLYKGPSVYVHVDPFIRSFIRKSVKGGKVSANIQGFKSNKLSQIFKLIKDHYQVETDEMFELWDIYMNGKETDKKLLHDNLKNLKNVSELMAFDANGLYMNGKETDKKLLHDNLKNLKNVSKLMAFDANGLYASAIGVGEEFILN
ncbi:hypothetical protein LOTGIDRAFT_175254 [Lottia gigantea]|uniref:DNA-directed DNA polymerase n=1 Tax=Lottia gigantea TaxID=225164 RepID=V4C137_LOTGI|nr:hypothetical protein LOTGIDRAFT_175254 [Lottia gigantea]ESO95179.1 hypothetical protein LOTGIDRAFT_175254 [Lottia gigantea]